MRSYIESLEGRVKETTAEADTKMAELIIRELAVSEAETEVMRRRVEIEASPSTASVAGAASAAEAKTKQLNLEKREHGAKTREDVLKRD